MPLPSSDYATLQNAAVATGNGAILPVADRAVVRFQVTGTFSATVIFEATIDASTWVALIATSYTNVISAYTTTAGTFFAPVAGYRYVRARISTYTSGSVTVVAMASTAAAPLQSPNNGNNGIDSVTITNTNPITSATNFLFSGTYWDRQRGNMDVTVLSSAARTATTNSSDQTNYNGRGVIVTLDVTAITDTPELTLSIEGKIGSNYEALLTASAAVTATGVHTYIVYPGVGAASGDVVQVAGFPLPRTWRVTVTAADTDSATYSVTASVIL